MTKAFVRSRIHFAILVVLLLVVGYNVIRSRSKTAPAAAALSAPEVIVALEPTPVPLGSRQLLPIFSHRDGHTFELQLRVTAWGDAKAQTLPEPETTFTVTVREPSGSKRFLDRPGRLTRGAPGVRATDIVPDALSNPPIASSVELLATFVYEAPAGQTETLEIEVTPVTGRDVARATAEVRVYELAERAPEK
jgi:hypothetical protein